MTGETSGPKLSDDGRFWWDGDRWSPVPEDLQPERRTAAFSTFLGVFAALVVVAVIGWFIYGMATANDDVQCAQENAQRSLDGLPPTTC